MTGRWVLAALVAAALTFGAASATSLGTFDDVPFSAMHDDVAACRGDAALVGPLGTTILLGGVLSAVTVEEVALTNLQGDCDGTVPVVVTVGNDGGGAGEVLDVLDLTGRTVLGGTDPIDLDVLPTDALFSLLDGTVAVSEVRVAFCPQGATCT